MDSQGIGTIDSCTPLPASVDNLLEPMLMVDRGHDRTPDFLACDRHLGIVMNCNG
ncbi:hypothetical protein [Myxacorys almedinensis]|uniref:Uncharacterized protein n=1 Tax=Myxacorys almedinensis A TaxID=2690445 RepID=A0A8J7ZB52_9CYAN|nr:hypothetical protein [Myxacorys almedinensis]NDJ19708.1 hypothetical protein [Myxacorys almedinensis A]